jgi:hypothetical protein
MSTLRCLIEQLRHDAERVKRETKKYQRRPSRVGQTSGRGNGLPEYHLADGIAHPRVSILHEERSVS